VIGTLYVVSTPIGNLEDITLRAVRILSEVDGIAAEDTRHTLKLLNHLSIRKPLLSLHEHNETERISLMMEKLDLGENWALVSDAGTPGICDPGAQLISSLRQNGYPCVPIPGVSALATALSMSGLQRSFFHFEGFLPPRGTERKQRIEALSNMDDPILLYESPHRLKSTLLDLFTAMHDRRLTVFRELTKLHEQIYDTTLSEAIQQTDAARGEYVLLLHARPEQAFEVSEEDIKIRLQSLLGSGLPKKEAVARTALELHVRKNQVYRLSIDL